jgi:hypothetical protein
LLAEGPPFPPPRNLPTPKQPKKISLIQTGEGAVFTPESTLPAVQFMKGAQIPEYHDYETCGKEFHRTWFKPGNEKNMCMRA